MKMDFCTQKKIIKCFLKKSSYFFLVIPLLLFLKVTKAEESWAPVQELERSNYDLNFDMVCDQISEFQVKYCVWEPRGGSNNRVLYYMHGLNGNEQSWYRDGLPLRLAWGELGHNPPRVINLSFGGIWLLANKNSSSESGLLPRLIDDVIPAIEKKLGMPPKPERLLFGVSMGGFNTTQLIYERPEYFHKAALACPAITSVSPHADEGEIRDYITRTKAMDANVRLAIKVAKRFFPKENDWQKAAPLNIVNKLPSWAPSIFVSNTTNDEYGFQEGGIRFAQLAQSRGLVVFSQILQGPHCIYDGLALAKFFNQDLLSN